MNVHQASRDDLPAITETLARAFHDDPVVIHLLGGRFDHRRSRLAFRMLALNMLDHGMVLTTNEREAAALWARPGEWKVPFSAIIRTLPLTVRAYQWRIPRALDVLTRMEKIHPVEPHYYLEVLGTDPRHQGRGLGAGLMNHVLDMADDEHVGAYLESSKDSNVPYYRRFGFEVVDEIVHRNGPKMWFMWRDPR